MEYIGHKKKQSEINHNFAPRKAKEKMWRLLIKILNGEINNNFTPKKAAEKNVEVTYKNFKC